MYKVIHKTVGKMIPILFSGIFALSLFSGCSKSDSIDIGADQKSSNKDEKMTAVKSSEILVGSVSALSGNASFLGTQLTKGSQAYFNKINDEGGVNGKKIKFVTRDDKYEPANTIAETKKMMDEDKAFVLFDYVGTPTSKEIMPIVESTKIPLLGIFTGAEFLRTPLKPTVFNVRASYYQESSAIIEKTQKDGKKKIAVFYQDDAFGLAVLEGTNIALGKLNSKPIALATYKRNEKISEEAVQKIISSNPDAVVMVGTYSQLAQFVKSAKEKGLKNADFYTVSFVGSEALATELDKYDENTRQNVFVSQVVPDPTDESVPVVKEFMSVLSKYHNGEKPNYVSLEGYINAKVLVEAIKRSGDNLSRESLLKSLESLSDFNTGTGIEIKVSSQNHQMFNSVFISKYNKGKFEIMK